MLKCVATDTDDPTEDPRFGRVGKQKIEDTGPLTKKRMETVDEEFLGAAMDFIDRQHKAGKPFFCWFNSTRMHIYTHLKPESKGKTGLGIEADGMVEFDGMVGQLLKKLDDLGIADNTIVLWTTDNGAEVFSWPDGGTTPFRGEKNTNWEGGYRVPGMMRWPGVIKPGTEINDIVSHEDWVPTFVAAAGEPNVKEKLLTGYEAAGKTFKVHLDGYDQRDLLAGTGPGKRKEYLLLDRRRQPRGLRYEPLEDRVHGAAGAKAWTSGRTRWSRCASRSSSTSAPTPSSGPSTTPATTTGGASSAPSRSSRRRPSWPSTCRPTRSSRRGRSPAASRSTRCWRNCRRRAAARTEATGANDPR